MTPARREKRVLTPFEVNNLENILSSLETFSPAQGAKCYYRVPSRGIWQATLSCLISQGLQLGEAARIASQIYSLALSKAAEKRLSPEAVVAEVLNQTKHFADQIRNEKTRIQALFGGQELQHEQALGGEEKAIRKKFIEREHEHKGQRQQHEQALGGEEKAIRKKFIERQRQQLEQALGGEHEHERQRQQHEQSLGGEHKCEMQVKLPKNLIPLIALEVETKGNFLQRAENVTKKFLDAAKKYHSDYVPHVYNTMIPWLQIVKKPKLYIENAMIKNNEVTGLPTYVKYPGILAGSKKVQYIEMVDIHAILDLIQHAEKKDQSKFFREILEKSLVEEPLLAFEGLYDYARKNNAFYSVILRTFQLPGCMANKLTAVQNAFSKLFESNPLYDIEKVKKLYEEDPQGFEIFPMLVAGAHLRFPEDNKENEEKRLQWLVNEIWQPKLIQALQGHGPVETLPKSVRCAYDLVMGAEWDDKNKVKNCWENP